jgi:UDP-galactose transporter B1
MARVESAVTARKGTSNIKPNTEAVSASVVAAKDAASAAVPAEAVTSPLRDALDLLLCTASIYACYIAYGILHEKLTRQAYGIDADTGKPARFTYSLFTTTAQCFGNALWALLLITIEAFRRPSHHAHGPGAISVRTHLYHLVFDHVPKHKYALIAASYSIAMFSSTSALKFVSYPIQALAKSSKLIPVMVGRVLTGAKYSAREVLHVLLITGGIAAFFYFETPKAAAKAAVENSWWGILLLALSLCMDAVTGPTQESVSRDYKPTVMTMTLWINLFPFAVMAAVTAATGELAAALAFCRAHPEIYMDLAIYCFLSAVGQSVIVWALFRFDSMTVTVVTTTRKFLTILVSVFWFGNALNLLQWAGVLVVFLGIGADSQHKYVQKHKKHHGNGHAHSHAHGPAGAGPAAPQVKAD